MPAVVFGLLLLDPIVPGSTELVLAAVAGIGPAPLPAKAGPVYRIAMTALGIADPQVTHHGTPLGTVRWRLAMACDRDQVGDFVRHGGGDEVIPMRIGKPQVEA